MTKVMKMTKMKAAVVLLATVLVAVMAVMMTACEHDGGLLGKLDADPRRSPDRIDFLEVEVEGAGAGTPQQITLGNEGDQPANFTLEENANWLELSEYSITSDGPDDDVTVDVTPELAGLLPGVYLATIWARCGEWQETVDVELVVVPYDPVSDNILYVSIDGNDTLGNGSFANPYRTVTKGVSMLTIIAGKDTVYILPSDVPYDPSEPGESFPIELVDGTTVTAAGPEYVEISGGGSSGVFTVSSGQTCALSGLTVSDGNAALGGGLAVSNASTVTVTDCVFESCTSTGNGGAADVASGCVVGFTGCVFRLGDAAVAGGAVYDAAGATYDDCVFESCTAGGNSGAVDVGAACTFSRCVFRQNDAGGEGGAVHDAAGATYNDCVFESNTATNEGGAFYGAGGQFTGCLFTGNSTPGDGGGISAGGSVTVTATTFLANMAGESGVSAGNGGGCYLGAAGKLDGCVFNSNRAVLLGVSGGSGGGVYSVGIPTVKNCTLTSNVAEGDGGALHYAPGGVASGAAVPLQGCVIRHNSAGGNGGGFFLDNNASPLDATRNVFAHNSAAEGGGVHVKQGNLASPGHFRNSLLHHNEGGLAIEAGSADVWGCTFADNTSYGLKRIGNASTVDLLNSIFWQNVDDLDNVLDATITYCYISDGDDPLDPTNIDVSSNPDPLFANPTGEDYHLRPSSPCVDKGNDPGGLGANDLDGNPRIVDGDGDATATVDMGCYEYQP